MSLRILNLEPHGYSDSAFQILTSCGEVENGPFDRQELLARVGEFDILIARLGHRIDEEVLARANRLKAIATATTGLNHIDMPAAARRDIEVLSLRGQRQFLDTITASAELTMALMLALVRGVPWAFDDVRQGHWERDKFKGIDLHGRTISVVGLGRLGTIISQYASAFGMNIVAHDPNVDDFPPHITNLPLKEAVAQGSIVTLHVLLDSQNQGFFNSEIFEAMQLESYFINTSRGELIDQSALLEALETGAIRGAALDVLNGEKPGQNTMQNDPLIQYARDHKNLLITPHIGGATSDSMEKTEIHIAERIADWVQRSGGCS